MTMSTSGRSIACAPVASRRRRAPVARERLGTGWIRYRRRRRAVRPASAPLAFDRSGRSRRSRRRRHFLPHVNPAVGRHDPPQRIDVGPIEIVAMVRRRLPRIPHRAQNLPGDAVAGRRRRETRASAAPVSSGAPPSPRSASCGRRTHRPTALGPAASSSSHHARVERAGSHRIHVDARSPHLQRQRSRRSGRSPPLTPRRRVMPRQRVGRAAA